MSDRLAASLDRVRAWVRRRIRVDTRALAAMRIGLGSVLLADLLLRARNLTAFYTDAGVLPRPLLRAVFPGFASVSLHTLSGALWAQGVLFGVAGVGAIALLVGYRTRLATAVSLVLVVSLHARNPVVLNAGDSLLRRLLLWGLFLPLGDRWSLDALRARSTPRPAVAGVASAALLVQVVVVYLANAAFKLRGELWLEGTAIRYVFGVDQLTVWLGDLLAEFPAVLVALDRVWLAMILGAWLLLVLTGRARTAFAALFAGMHVGMFLTMRLGLFPLISVVGLCPFLHPGVWDAVEARLGPPLRRRVDLGRIGRWLGEPWSLSAAIPRRRGLGRLVVAGLLAALLVWNAATLGYVDLPRSVESTADPDAYRWDMFAPEPRMTDGWYVTPGRLPSGDRVDAFRGGPVSWDRPPDTARTFPTHRWFVYLLDLQRPAYRALRPSFAAYLCRRYAARHDRELTGVAVYYVRQRVQLDGYGPPRRVLLANRSCAPTVAPG